MSSEDERNARIDATLALHSDEPAATEFECHECDLAFPISQATDIGSERISLQVCLSCLLEMTRNGCFTGEKSKLDLPPDAVMAVQADLGMASICGWCATKTQADAWANRHGLSPSHGICPTCHGMAFPEIKIS